MALRRPPRLGLALLVGALAPASVGCRLNPECFGANECDPGLVCFRGSCIVPQVSGPPDSGAPGDGGPAIDAGFPDAGFIDAGVATYTWTEDVVDIVRSRCATCHGDPLLAGAPMPLVSWLDTQQPSPNGGLIHERMAQRIIDPADPMPPATATPLTNNQIQVLRIWSSEGAPFGPPPDAGFPDLGGVDLGFPDAGFIDTGVPPDVGFPDTGVPPDSGLPDLGFPDGSQPAGAPMPGPMPGGVNPVQGVSAPVTVASGYQLLESPVWVPTSSVVLFSDIPGGTIFQIDPANGDAVSVYLANTQLANGTVITTDGDLFACQHGARAIATQPAGGGALTPLVTNYRDYRLNSPNDITARSDGTLYFTDPPYGLNGRTQALPFNALFRIAPGTSTAAVEWPGVVGMHGPNGVALSPDETVLYVSEVEQQQILAFDVAPDGSVSNGRVFALTRGVIPDGLAVDDDGNLYVTSSFGIEVYAPNGYYWGNITFPESLSNLTFANPNRSRIYATSATSVYRIDVPVPGPLR